mgnify:CR=1 FL=1
MLLAVVGGLHGLQIYTVQDLPEENRKQALASLFIVIGLVLFTLAGPFVWTVDPSAQEMGRISEAPSLSRRVTVLPEDSLFEPLVLADQPEAPTAEGASLPAPAKVEIIGPASTQFVRLQWAHVPGAAGYSIYRGDSKPTSHDNLGVLFDLCRTLDLQLLIAAPEVARAEGNTTYRLVRRTTPEGREEVLVSGRRTRTEA